MTNSRTGTIMWGRSSDPQQKILLYDSRTPNTQEPETPIRVSDDIMRATIELDVAGQIWALTIYEQTSNQDAQKNWLLWIVLVGGLLCSAFIGGYIIVLSANAERLEREMRKEGLKAGRALGVATMLTLISLTFSIIVWTEYQKQEHKLISQIAQEEITNITHNIGYRVSETIMALERMAARWEIRQSIPMAEWTYDAANLIKDYNALKVVEWVDDSYHVKWVEPIAGNEAAIGLNVVFDEVRRKALEGAAESDHPTLTPPIDLVQGYRGLIAYVPLNVKDRFDGFIVGIYDLNEFIGNLIPQQFMDLFAIEVVDQDKIVFSNIEARNAKDGDFFYTKAFKVYDREWIFSAEPKPEYFKKHVSKYAYLGLLGGALLSILIGISVYTVMISNRRNALLLKSERALQAANAELEEFAYRTSHDLRSPVVSSLALAHMIEKHIAEGNQTKATECLGMMVPAMNKLQSLIEDILNLTRAKSEQENLVSVDLTEIITNTRAKLSGIDNYDRVTFDTDLEVTTIDNILKNRLTLIISNLISNAYKYQDTTQPESYIRLRSYRDDDYIVIEVEDNGMGIPPENREQMFQMFKRFHPKESFGSGLGLYMIKKSAEKLGGDIKYIAKAQGSIFRLVLPD